MFFRTWATGIVGRRLFVEFSRTRDSSSPWQQVYLGNESNDADVRLFFEKYKDQIAVETLNREEVAKRAVELLQKNTVIGLFQDAWNTAARFGQSFDYLSCQ